MTCALRAFRIVALAATVAFSPGVAASQTGARPPGQQDGWHPPMAGVQGSTAAPDVIGQLAVLDARVKALMTDMRALSGEPKVEAMVALLTAMVERQALIELEMRTIRDGMMREGMIREGMMRHMMGRSSPPADGVEETPGGMCAPAN